MKTPITSTKSTSRTPWNLLDEPGEWYFDRPARTVYYLPRPSEDMTSAVVIVPAIERLVDLKGTLDNQVKNIRFLGITFSDADWLSPSTNGFVDVQANFQNDLEKTVGAGSPRDNRSQRADQEPRKHRMPRRLSHSFRAMHVYATRRRGNRYRMWLAK